MIMGILNVLGVIVIGCSALVMVLAEDLATGVGVAIIPFIVGLVMLTIGSKSGDSE